MLELMLASILLNIHITGYYDEYSYVKIESMYRTYDFCFATLENSVPSFPKDEVLWVPVTNTPELGHWYYCEYGSKDKPLIREKK